MNKGTGTPAHSACACFLALLRVGNRSNLLGAEGGEALGEALPFLPALQHLYLRCSSFRFHKSASMTAVFRRFENFLHLRRVGVTVVGVTVGQAICFA